MAPTSLIKPYRLDNFPELTPVLERARESMTAKLRDRIVRAIDSGDDGFSREFQLEAPSTERQRTYTVKELAESSEHEVDYQRLFPELVEDVLFGRLGMVRRIGGGNPMQLQRDLLIGWIVRRSENVEIGPIIAGGRHRFMALQILLKAAVPGANIEPVQLRCMTRQFRSRDELVRAIFADQEGRTMTRAEKREREANGLDTTSIEGLKACLEGLKRDDYPTALGGFVRLYAIRQGLNELALDQFAASGVTAYNLLKKANKGLNQRVHDSHGKLLEQLGDAACSSLVNVLPDVVADKSRGPRNSKLAKALARHIAAKLDLSYVA